MTRLSDYRKTMRHPVLVELLDHWEILREGRIAPRRSELDPRRIENALEHAFILEQPPTGQPRFRIAGMALSALMGMEIRGMPATALIRPEGRDAFLSILNRMFACPEIADLDLTARSDPSGRDQAAEMLLLPVTTDDGRVSRILAALVTCGQPPEAPCRFVVTDHRVTRIVASTRAEIAGFAETAASFSAARPATTKRRGHLRLVAPKE